MVTTEEVLTETINFFASFPSPMKKAVFQLLTQVVTDSHINVIPQSHESFTFKIAQSEETYQEFKQPPPNPQGCFMFENYSLLLGHNSQT